MKVTRQDLYDQVWKEPVVKVAKKYGISDVALKKHCRKLDIPTPPLGYWAKLAHGKQPRQMPLPKRKEDAPDFAVIPGGSARVDDKVNEDVLRKLDQIVVPEVLENPHPLTKLTVESLRGALPGEDGIVYPKYPHALSIAVKPENVERALRIMDTLVKAAREIGIRIICLDSDGERCTQFEIHGQRIEIGLSEIGDYWCRPGFALRIYGHFGYGSSGYGRQRNWHDSPKLKIEQRIGNFLRTIVRLALDESARFEKKC